MYKKTSLLLSLLLCVCLMPLNSAFASNVKGVKDEKHKGIVIEHLPFKASSKSIPRGTSFISLSNLVVNGNQLSLDGTLTYRDNKIQLNLEGALYQSHIKSNDILIDVNQSNSSSGELEVVFWKVYNSGDDDLQINKKSFGSAIMVLNLFNRQARTLYSYEIPLDDYDMAKLDGISFERSNEVSDAWYYKIMEGTVNEDFVTPMATVSRSVTVSTGMTYKNPYGDGCDEQHYKSGTFGLNGADPARPQNHVYASLKVTSQYITRVCNYQYTNIYTDSAVWWGKGNGSDPVTMAIEFSGYNQASSTLPKYRDYINITKWWGSYSKPISLWPDVTVGVSYGPISAGYTLSKTFSVSDNSPKTVYFNDSNYSYKQDYFFKNTFLYSNNSYYTADAEIAVAANSNGYPYRKVATATLKLPVYSNGGGLTYYTTKNYTVNYEYYTSQ